MQSKWFPIIDYEKCTGFLECVNFCHYGVFEVSNGIPIVKNPQNCVEFCRGCQKGACDFDAISFPPDFKDIEIKCACGS